MAIRFATFNASLNRAAEGDLITDLSTPENTQAQAIAETIQRNNPDVVLINEFDYDATGTAAALFQKNYLAVSQNGVDPVDYPYVYAAPSNTGIPSGLDLNNDGSIGGPDDAYGFGFFPGQFAFVIYSKYPIVEDQIRTFQEFLWADMPGALLPTDPNDADGNGDTANWFTSEELAAVRLSSKNHVDLPVEVNGEIIHVLASHPTPPVFDGPEDRNGRRNYDEIRFWADYIEGADYIYDDNGLSGGLAAGTKFVIMGDQNSDPFDGDSIPGSAQLLLDNPLVNTAVTPSSQGGVDAAERQGLDNLTHLGNPAFDTADFGEAPFGPGNLRADYALPSSSLGITDAGVFWLPAEDPLFDRLNGDFPFPTSDHRLVYVDVADTLPNGVASGDVTQDSVVLWARSTAAGEVTFDYSTDADFASIAGTVTATVTDGILPVKVEVEGLDAGTEYYFRATDAAGLTKAGRFITAAEQGTYTGFTFGIGGDWQQAPPYPILNSAANRNLDVFVKLGDTIYADLETPALPGVTQARALSDFRTKHSEVLSPRFGLSATADLQATTSIIATIDDHEIVDNFAGGAAPGESPDAPDIGSSPDPLFTDAVEFVNDTQVYEDALQAYQEYQPIRDEFYGETGDERTAGERQLYRAQSFGSDASIFVTDSRSFRDGQLEPASLANPTEFLVQAFDPSRTLLGRAQVDLLKADLLEAQENGTTWKFVVIPEPIQNFGVANAEDRFEGYAAERTELLSFIDQNAIDNVVFMAGDFHGTIVNNLTYQAGPGQAQIATNAFEIVTGPVAFFDGRFGPNVIDIAANFGLITPEQRAFYDALPVNPDLDDTPNDKDDFLKQVLVSQTDLLGYDPVGLNDNLAAAEGLINATLLQGDYVSAHTFSWTELDVDAETQTLTVTTYGIDAYSEADLLANPQAVLDLMPRIVSQFEVQPTLDAPTPVAELIDLTGFDGDVAVNVTVTREAAFDNVLKFYETDARGAVGGLLPGEAGYEAAVAANLLDAELFVGNNAAADLDLTLVGGAYYAPALLIDGSLTNLATVEDVTLGSAQVKREGNTWSFEDHSDNDFNDLMVTLNSAEAV
ncbi:MAG TPA: alkaline phosphatase D family protein [Nodosilinea sp.]|nr:alkaline phosphatase D family protein [Nodosilinea sp.]